MEGSVESYDVLTSDGQHFGHVAEVRNGYLVVEHGLLFKTQRAVPEALVTVDDESEIVHLVVSKEEVEDSPVPGRELDQEQIDSYYATCGSTEFALGLPGSDDSHDSASAAERERHGAKA
jgi:hypothetical protein